MSPSASLTPTMLGCWASWRMWSVSRLRLPTTAGKLYIKRGAGEAEAIYDHG